ncbi:aromatic-ring-hydroxylating dioxygenase subunit beta [Pusillimonas sp. CC-YST705]|uniref:Aromatic-ring-hydroxylating dioxygenase subunit beta n=1 Tax=Mesopusillimonas faecipullorum TaxID=2755040 RepID=A0ABS8CF85_9BURK|nr:aromatic-ring-hydroxylating dioxygenase subunit beta [Mesopusillimonas faecipullorum]MCB5364710.1 aromatic-ring-hydroxylating dioxygenase subunit beta [Mesopusillimonas faecipullorum]
MLLDRTFDHSVEAVSSPELSFETVQGIQQFLFHEARLLDERRLDEWLALWTPDGRYWVPRIHGQENPFEHVSLFWEDALLREVRVRRLMHPRNWSQQPVTRGNRLIGNISIEGADAAGHIIVRSCLHLVETRLDTRYFGASVFHKLAATEQGGWAIQLKRVNLTNCEGVLGMLDMHI